MELRRACFVGSSFLLPTSDSRALFLEASAMIQCARGLGAGCLVLEGVEILKKKRKMPGRDVGTCRVASRRERVNFASRLARWRIDKPPVFVPEHQQWSTSTSTSRIDDAAERDTHETQRPRSASKRSPIFVAPQDFAAIYFASTIPIETEERRIFNF